MPRVYAPSTAALTTVQTDTCHTDLLKVSEVAASAFLQHAVAGQQKRYAHSGDSWAEDGALRDWGMLRWRCFFVLVTVPFVAALPLLMPLGVWWKDSIEENWAYYFWLVPLTALFTLLSVLLWTGPIMVHKDACCEFLKVISAVDP